ncbi:MAG: hypothetical protein K0R17_2547 [Rariglobus sp.]|jgi:hypothetical protein|nr:hypothetical protein [Rariglobus sp.]
MSSQRDQYSCTGSFLASRIPVDENGNFPINRTLIAVLAGGLLFFNQGLFWLLAELLAGQGRDVVANRFLVASLAVGAGLWLVLTLVQAKATGGGRMSDWLVVALTGGLGAAGLLAKSPACLVAAVLLLMVWGLRGLKRPGN